MAGNQRTKRMSGIVPRRIRKSLSKLRRRRSSSVSKATIPDIQLTQSNVTAEASIASSAAPSPTGSYLLDLHQAPAFDDAESDDGYLSDSTTEGESRFTTEEDSFLLDDTSVSILGEDVEPSLTEDSSMLGKESSSEEECTTEEGSLLLDDTSATIVEAEGESSLTEESSITGKDISSGEEGSSILGREISAGEAPELEPIETEFSLLDAITGPESPSDEFEDDEEVSSTTSVTAVHNGRFVSPVAVRTMLTSPTSSILCSAVEEKVCSPISTAPSSDIQSAIEPAEDEDLFSPTSITTIFERCVSFSDTKDIMFSPNTIIRVPEEESICSAITTPTTTSYHDDASQSISPLGAEGSNENTLSIFRDLHSSEIVYEDVEDDEDSEEGQDLLRITFTPSEDLLELAETKENFQKSNTSTEQTRINSTEQEQTRNISTEQSLRAKQPRREQQQVDSSLLVWKLVSLFFFIAAVVLFGQQQQIGKGFLLGRKNDQASKLEAQRREIRKKKLNFLPAQNDPMGVWLK